MVSLKGAIESYFSFTAEDLFYPTTKYYKQNTLYLTLNTFI
jgi:hypothetical protein